MPTEQELEKLYNVLPKNTARDLLTSPNTANYVRSLARKYNFNASDTEMLLNEIGLVLLGVESHDTFSDDLVEVLDMKKEQADQITKELTLNIFSLVEKSNAIQNNQTVEHKKETSENEKERMRQLLRANSKTVNIKNLIDNLE